MLTQLKQNINSFLMPLKKVQISSLECHSSSFV